MQIIETALPEVKIIEPAVFGDDRGFFFESFNQKKFDQLIGPGHVFVQDNHSRSQQGVLRGLHYQIQSPQGKLVRVTLGEIYDVAVDIRRGSPNYGKWVGVSLSSENKLQLWVPAGFAHGFYTSSEFAEVQYKTTDYYAPEHERSILWNDQDLDIQWPITVEPKLSQKDIDGKAFHDADVFD